MHRASGCSSPPGWFRLLGLVLVAASMFGIVWALVRSGSAGWGIGPRWLLTVGLTLQGLGLLWVAYNAHQHYGYTASVLALIISGAGTTMAMPAQQSAVMTSVEPAACL